jgi:hypothetical protein
MNNLLSNNFKKIKSKTLIPIQQPTSLGFKKKTDFYCQKFIKHQGVSEFHSYQEYLFAALNESNPDVSCFVTQPFKLRFGRKLYTPDCFYLENGKHKVVEIKSEHSALKFDVKLWKEYFEFHNMKFSIITNESILKVEIKARNWLMIVRALKNNDFLDTESQEHTILDDLVKKGNLTFKDVIDTGDRENSIHNETALFRLAHRGKVKLECSKQTIHWDTEIHL